jgi:sugar transferase (PEP-CTERM/EpsH1 system associated)
MKILYLAHRVPYPPNKGEKIRYYYHLRHLAAAHEVHLVSLADEPEDTRWAEALRAFCRSVSIVRLDRRRALLRAAFSLSRGRSASEAYFAAPGLSDAVHAIAAGETFDVVWSSSSAIASYLTRARARRRIADFVDVDSEKWRDFAAHERPPLSWLHRLEARRLGTAEIRAAEAADRVLFVSAEEESLFRSFAPAGVRTTVVGSGVDTESFQPAAGRDAASHPEVLFTGTLDYRPNVDAVAFLIDEVLPRVWHEIPAARFTAVGHRPVSRLLRAARRAGERVTIAGDVPDVRPFFDRATACAAPLRFGRGVKAKALEAMASGVPLVASRCAIAGLAAKAGEHFLPAESAAELAAALVSIWRQPDLARSLAASALGYVREHHRWEVCLRSLDVLLDECRGGSAMGQVK